MSRTQKLKGLVAASLRVKNIKRQSLCSCNFLCIQRSFQAIEKISAISIIDINMQDNRVYIVNYVRTVFRAQVRTGA